MRAGQEQKLKIGVMGAAAGQFTTHQLAMAMALGRAVAGADAVLVTGACPGLPFAAAAQCKAAGGTVLGISPGLSLNEHIFKYGSPVKFHDILVYTGSGLMGREITNIRSSDIVVIIGGRSGTLGELAIAHDEGKLIGVVTGTGGISDIVEGILAACGKDTGAKLFYDDQPVRLVETLVDYYRQKHFQMACCFDRDSLQIEDTTMETDPVCGMRVDKGAAEVNLDGHTYHFCSNVCADVFKKHPGSFSVLPCS